MRFTSLYAVMRRELVGYFTTPLAVVFVVIFTVASAGLAFYAGNFFDRGIADMDVFFQYQPWLHLLLAPAIAMRLWAEERRSGTLELLLTLPLTAVEIVLGKFIAAWLFAATALLATMPFWISVNVLGDPDNGVIIMGYCADLLMVGTFLAIGGCLSALTRNQVIAFILGAGVCFLVMVTGLDPVLDVVRDVVPPLVADGLASSALIQHYNGMIKGIFSAGNAVFFAGMIGFWLYATVIIVRVHGRG